MMLQTRVNVKLKLEGDGWSEQEQSFESPPPLKTHSEPIVCSLYIQSSLLLSTMVLLSDMSSTRSREAP